MSDRHPRKRAARRGRDVPVRGADTQRSAPLLRYAARLLEGTASRTANPPRNGAATTAARRFTATMAPKVIAPCAGCDGQCDLRVVARVEVDAVAFRRRAEREERPRADVLLRIVRSRIWKSALCTSALSTERSLRCHGPNRSAATHHRHALRVVSSLWSCSGRVPNVSDCPSGVVPRRAQTLGVDDALTAALAAPDRGFSRETWSYGDRAIDEEPLGPRPVPPSRADERWLHLPARGVRALADRLRSRARFRADVVGRQQRRA